MPNCEHHFLPRPERMHLQEVSFLNLLIFFNLAANSCWPSQEVERPSLLLVLPGEERATERSRAENTETTVTWVGAHFLSI